MGQKHPKRVRLRGTQGRVHIGLLRIVRGPVVRVVDTQEGEHRPVPLDHVAAVLHEHLARIATALDDVTLARVAVVVTEHRDDAQRRRELAERAHVRRDVGAGDVNHVARLHDQIGPKRVCLRHDLLHHVLAEVDAGVQVREVKQLEPVEPVREVGECKRAMGDLGKPVGAPDAIRRQRDAGAGVGVGGASEETTTRDDCVVRGEWLLPMRLRGTVDTGLNHVPRTTHFGREPPYRLAEQVDGDERAENPSQQLPRDPWARERDPAHAPHAAAEQHPLTHDEPREVEHDEDRGQHGAHPLRPTGPGGVGKALAQVQVDQHLRCQEEKEID